MVHRQSRAVFLCGLLQAIVPAKDPILHTAINAVQAIDGSGGVSVQCSGCPQGLGFGKHTGVTHRVMFLLVGVLRILGVITAFWTIEKMGRRKTLCDGALVMTAILSIQVIMSTIKGDDEFGLRMGCYPMD